MKRSDIAMIILIASASALVAYFVTSSLLGGVNGDTTKVKTIDPIYSEIIEPSDRIFNKNSINPAVEVQINSTENP